MYTAPTSNYNLDQVNSRKFLNKKNKSENKACKDNYLREDQDFHFLNGNCHTIGSVGPHQPASSSSRIIPAQAIRVAKRKKSWPHEDGQLRFNCRKRTDTEPETSTGTKDKQLAIFLSGSQNEQMAQQNMI